MSRFKILRKILLFYMLDCWLFNAFFFFWTLNILRWIVLFFIIKFIFGGGSSGSKYSVVYGQHVPKNWNVY